MGSFLYRMLDWCRWLFGVVPKSAVGSPRSYLFVHYIFMALIAIVLCLHPVTRWIRETVPFFPPRSQNLTAMGLTWVDDSWCGVLFILFYGIVRLVLYILSILGIEDDSEFPDIEADWQEILAALERERLYIDELPLFLVNGLTPQQETSAFDSAFEAAGGSEWRVVAPPITRTSAVIRVFGRDDALFLCTSGVGATGCQQGKVATEGDDPIPRSVAHPVSDRVTGTQKAGPAGDAIARPRSVTGTAQAGAIGKAAAPAPAAPGIRPAPAASRSFFGTMLPGGLRKAMQTFAAVNQGALKGYGKKRVLPISELESLVGVRRMRFLCQLITRARKPFCGINGMIQAIPLSWTSEPDYARKLAPAIRDDLIAVHTAFQLQFPVVAMVTELDDVAGVKEFLLRSERLQPGLRLSRAGCSFAPGADVNDTHAEWVVDGGLRWFRGWVYNAFSYDIDNRDNSRLFQMICELGQRREGLIILLRESLYRIVRPSVRLYGVYFSATGRSSTEQGFIRGVLDKLPDSQNEVAWTPQFSRGVQRSRMFAVWLFVGAVAAGIGTLFFLGQIIPRIG
ncbi:MAG: hypothetical protein KDA96_04050 [Planctomycetaceae bacterium]|nr:hypothetical protein [Planctomycetaceae bacterium]